MRYTPTAVGYTKLEISQLLTTHSEEIFPDADISRFDYSTKYIPARYAQMFVDSWWDLQDNLVGTSEEHAMQCIADWEYDALAVFLLFHQQDYFGTRTTELTVRMTALLVTSITVTGDVTDQKIEDALDIQLPVDEWKKRMTADGVHQRSTVWNRDKMLFDLE